MMNALSKIILTTALLSGNGMAKANQQCDLAILEKRSEYMGMAMELVCNNVDDDSLESVRSTCLQTKTQRDTAMNDLSECKEEIGLHNVSESTDVMIPEGEKRTEIGEPYPDSVLDVLRKMRDDLAKIQFEIPQE